MYITGVVLLVENRGYVVIEVPVESQDRGWNRWRPQNPLLFVEIGSLVGRAKRALVSSAFYQIE